jgi:hypothetical protein
MPSTSMQLDISKIIKRLELIKSLIGLEEESEIHAHISKLEDVSTAPEVNEIIEFLQAKAYSKAISAIDTFINKHHRLTVYLDPEINALKVEIQSLEAELNALSDEKADLEKLIHVFGIRHNRELGDLIIRILRYRKEKARGMPEQEEAENDYNSYQQEYEASKGEQIITLTENELKELKEKYRKASKLCHPDMVSEEQKELATRIFAELSIAYEKNDLKRVREILKNLESGDFFISKSDTINEKQLLLAEIQKMRLLIVEAQQQVQIIKESETYKTINNINNWDEYFVDTKKRLRLQLNDLESGK